MQVITGIIMILNGYHDHNDDDHHDDHHYQYDNENCVVDDYVELNKQKMTTKRKKLFFQICGLWIRAMIYTYPFNVIQVKSISTSPSL